MEIGKAYGGTLFGHCKLAAKYLTIISVDLPGGKFGGGYSDCKNAYLSGIRLFWPTASSHQGKLY